MPSQNRSKAKRSPDSSSIETKPSPSNWYAKLHPIGTAQQQTATPKRLLNLSIFFRIWLAVALVLVICGIVVFTQLLDYVKPTAQQVIEDTLLDTSKLLAASLQIPMQSGQLLTQDYQTQLDSAFVDTPTTTKSIIIGNRNASRTSEYNKHPSYRRKPHSSFRVYVTDSRGWVIYDSQPAPANAEGQDYSRWNDVYLTLQGQYGARSTPDINSERASSIMYVAQPIEDALGNLIGVVSVGKPIDSVLPYLDNTRRQMLITMLLISMAALILAGLVAWWLKQSISLVTSYTGALAEDTKKPYFYLGRELNSLTDTIETMKHRLENRAYVTDYVHTLTHELKSPLTAIRASSELLEDNRLDSDDRQMLSETINEQSIKMQQLIDRLLLLATVEQPTFKLNRQYTPILPLLNQLIHDNSAKIQQRQLAPITLSINDALLMQTAPIDEALLSQTTVYADTFWLTQALQNVLDNAIYFAATRVTICIETHHTDTSYGNNHTRLDPSVSLHIFNDGQVLPDYAVAKVFNRYFSLSHHSAAQNTHKKGTGLGLTLVKQVIEHHGGTISLNNISDDASTDASTNTNIRTNIRANIRTNIRAKQLAGVQVNITLPLAKPKNLS